MHWKPALAGALLVTLGAGSGQAHHSMAMFDLQNEMTVSGTVKSFQWSNPHCYVQVVAADGEGQPVEWSMEMGAPMYLYARGWRPSTLKPGETVTLRFHPLRNGRPGGVVIEAADASGKTIGRS